MRVESASVRVGDWQTLIIWTCRICGEEIDLLLRDAKRSWEDGEVFYRNGVHPACLRLERQAEDAKPQVRDVEP